MRIPFNRGPTKKVNEFMELVDLTGVMGKLKAAKILAVFFNIVTVSLNKLDN
ncbi:hypothetical protein [Rossellomorea sp. BNER]|uniref:hypothetical protein n=1 Tax=Rossellomorea sp. BNER TaxID=2962031 RepID=UPI003AF1FDB9|nr:hypothetical protein [Rossellomorea sp. BNER]